MNHRRIAAQCLGVSLMLSGTAPLHAANEDGVEVKQSEDALYCKERKLGTWFYCEKPREEPRKAATATQPPARERA